MRMRRSTRASLAANLCSRYRGGERPTTCPHHLPRSPPMTATRQQTPHTSAPTPAVGNFSTSAGLLLQRQCACGGKPGLSGACEECRTKRLNGTTLQTKLRLNEPGDVYEQ